MEATSTRSNQRIPLILLLIVVFVVASTISYLAIHQAVIKTIENQALSVAETVARQATTARSVYSQYITKKLKEDGTGGHIDYKNRPGYVPLPAQFLKLSGIKSSSDANQLYKYKPISKWNLEKTQGLNDDFLRWAWPQLEAQDSPAPESAIKWQPISRFEGEGSDRHLRYLYADPASQASCVSCHNAYENSGAIQLQRTESSTALGKQWKQHQLLGALSVTIPLAKVEFVGKEQVQKTVFIIFTILITSFLALAWFSFRIVKQERNLVNTERSLHYSEERRRVANDLLSTKQDLERAFIELSTYMQGINQHAMVSVSDADGVIIDVNEKFCQSSGYSKDELIGNSHNLLNSNTHSKQFFKNIWTTINTGGIWSGELCNKTKNGKLYWLDTSIVPLKDDNGVTVRYISIRIDITERKLNEERMLHMGTHDALTGLPNRILLQDRILQALAQNRRKKSHAAVLFIDLDQFKIINDSLGHDIGDLLLVEVASRLLSCVREEDTVARQGGDEFIILLPRLPNPEIAEFVAKKILGSLVKPYPIKSHELHISASIGLAVYPFDGDEVNVLMKNSDTAMYRAKASGRNNCQRFTSDMNTFAEEKLALLSDLRQSIARDELQLYYQPIIDIKSGQVVKLEALLRWQHPEKGFISPVDFIPLAEESGLILHIGDWVLNASFAQIKKWENQGYRVPNIAINLSVKQFYQNNLLSDLERLIETHQIDGQQVELEITEGILLKQTDELISTMHQIRKMGITISVDDFGTGYSSLSYIKSFPIDTLKIDRSFVADLTTDQGNTAIVKTIIALAHSFGMQVIAEGVESEEQLEFLRLQGCDKYQGYYYSRPLPVEQIVDHFEPPAAQQSSA